MRLLSYYGIFLLLLAAIAAALPPYLPLEAHTANRVWYAGYPNFIRVFVSYTIPEIKERREAYVDFEDPQKAAQYYWDLIRGADFYLYSPDRIRFIDPTEAPDPW